MTLEQRTSRLLEVFSTYALAEKVGCSQATICRISGGADPRYSIGIAIDTLYEELYGAGV